MLEIIAGIVTLLVTVLPVLLKNRMDNVSEGEVIRKKLVERDLAKLRADLERLQSRKARPVVPQ